MANGPNGPGICAPSKGLRPPAENPLGRFNAAQEDGFSARWLDQRELRELEPRIAPEIAQGLYAHGNAALDSYQYTLALAALTWSS